MMRVLKDIEPASATMPSEDNYLRVPSGVQGMEDCSRATAVLEPEVLEIQPNTYSPLFNPAAYRLTLLGANAKDLADAFQTTPERIQRWRELHPGFDIAIRRGSAEADGFVAQSLYRRATGYTHFEVKHFTADGVVTDSRLVAKHHPPDVRAAIYWLQNRRSRDWRSEQPPLPPGGGPAARLTDSEIHRLLQKAGLQRTSDPLEELTAPGKAAITESTIDVESD